jgi:hypothetical protein
LRESRKNLGVGAPGIKVEWTTMLGAGMFGSVKYVSGSDLLVDTETDKF